MYGVFEGELLDDTHEVNDHLNVALEVENVSFTWDAPPPEAESSKDKKKRQKAERKNGPPTAETHAPGEVFEMRNLTFSIPRGQLVAIVGAVGSGKSSLLQGIIGEMRQTVSDNGEKGHIVFGGSVAYCPQSAWIQVG